MIVFTDETCPMRAAGRAIEGHWMLPLVAVRCANGTLRYHEGKKALGITNVMLSNTLKEMEQEGLVARVQYNEIPPRVEYSLTEVSGALLPIVQAFCAWGETLLSLEETD